MTPKSIPGRTRLIRERDAARQEAERLRGAIEALADSEGWGDDAADEWWKDKLGAALQPPDGLEDVE